VDAETAGAITVSPAAHVAHNHGFGVDPDLGSRQLHGQQQLLSDGDVLAGDDQHSPGGDVAGTDAHQPKVGVGHHLAVDFDTAADTESITCTKDDGFHGKVPPLHARYRCKTM
jgi:hypothetical protein